MRLTNEHGIAALNWIVDHQFKFGLSKKDVSCLVGATSEDDIDQWFSGNQAVPENVMERLGLLIGIHRGLEAITPVGHENMAFEWFQRTTTIFPCFSGLSIRDYLLENPTDETLDTAYRSVRSLAG